MGTSTAGSVVALVPAAGRGLRLAAELPKAYVALAGESLLSRAVRGLYESGVVDRVVIAVDPADRNRAEDTLRGLPGEFCLVDGGAERSDSVRAALRVVTGAEVVLVHDAARCLAPAELIRAVVAQVRAGSGAVVPVLSVADTVKQVDPDGLVVATVDRSSLRLAQTPQGFSYDVLSRAHAGAGPAATDDASLVEALGLPVQTIPGDHAAFKITTPEDLVRAEQLVGVRSMRADR